MAKKIVRTRSEKRPMRSASPIETSVPETVPSASASNARPDARESDRRAIGADAEEHRMGEGDDAGVADEQIIARHHHDEDGDTRRGLDRAGAGKEEGRQRKRNEDHDQHDAEADAARPVAGEEADQHCRLISP